jgi:signal transduction histidine kinase/PAS domain-containing protein
MALSIKTKQVAGVTAIVGLAVISLSGWYVSSMAHILIEESESRAQLTANAVLQRAFAVVADSPDPYTGLQTDAGLRSILQASVFEDVTYAAVVDVHDVIIAHTDQTRVGDTLPAAGDLSALLTAGPIAQLRAIYEKGGRSLEFRQPLLLSTAQGTTEFGSIRVGVSTLLIRRTFQDQLATPLYTALGALIVATFVAMLLAQLVLRPIHVIRTGLARLGRGELDVRVDLPEAGELADLGDSFKAITARLAAERARLTGQQAALESVVEHFEDAVALFAPDGTLLFANPAMRPSLSGDAGPLSQLLPAGHPYRQVLEDTLASREARGPLTVQVPGGGDRLVVTSPVEDAEHRPVGAMLVARNLAYLSQVESTLSYSRKLAALSRLTAGIAHEIKNPLNATTIHLELLKIQLAEVPAAMEHVTVIAAQVRRLDEVVQGFLKFTRPEDLRLQPVALAPVLDEILPIIYAEAGTHHVDVRVDVSPGLPRVSADPAMLQQAFLNLALNACQAMPNGGRLHISAATRPGRQVQVTVEDTGVGIAPEDLARIFELYFTTKEHGSGIGLSMVYRTVQLHDGDIEVQSVPGRGTTFRILLHESTETGASEAIRPAS